MKVKWTEHRTNTEVLEMVQEKRSLMNTIRQRQKKWLGHLLRGDSLVRTVMEGRMLGKKVPGRPRMTAMDWMMNKKDQQTYKKLKDRVQDRRGWQLWIPGPV